MTPIQIRRLPEDFQVEELTSFTPTRGEYAIYKLAKRSLTTIDALDVIARSWNFPRASLSHAGMKDRHAVTGQFITIRSGPKENLSIPNIDLTYIGQGQRPIGPSDILGNRFSIVLRNFSNEMSAPITSAIEEIRKYHIPNYFDDQRFRSVGPSGEFIGRAWCESNYERALWLTLAEENESDRGNEKIQKRILREGWGRWQEVKDALDKSHRRSIITYLADHPVDFRGAFERVRVDLRRIYLMAFQSALWNRILRDYMLERVPDNEIIELNHSLGPIPVHRTLTKDNLDFFEKLNIPLPSARARISTLAMRDRIEKSLGELGLSLDQIKVKHGRDAFFPASSRPAMSRLGGLVYGFDTDELHEGRQLLRLSFELGRGSYATLFLKRILRECKEFDQKAMDDVEDL